MSSFFQKFSNFSLTSEIDKIMLQPTLYHEVIIMLSGALTIYLVADLRDLARSGKASIGVEELEAPVDLDRVLALIKDNKEALKASGAYDEIEERLAALDNLKLHNSNGVLNALLGQLGKASVVEFVDINAKEELVHAIVINHSQKRITVIFRGSVTTKDFITDAKVGQVKVDNPAFQLNKKASKDSFRLHYGFYEYMFMKNCPINKGKNRYEGIILSLKKLLEENKGYKVYCTGHSLGGALCTLFGFYAAADEEIAKLLKEPIRVISVASPYVGNGKFLMAFQSLERLGRLRHLRIGNAEDLVSLMPIAAPKIGLNLKDLKPGFDVYRHCGIKLHLNDLSKRGREPLYKLEYPKFDTSDDNIAHEINVVIEDGKNFLSSIKKVVKKAEQKDVLRYHSCEEYEARLNACKDKLQNITLESLYKDKSVVGDTMNTNYIPSLVSAKETINRISGSKLLQSTIKEILAKK